MSEAPPSSETIKMTMTMTNPKEENLSNNIEFVNYEDESQLADVMNLVLQDLSEPYSSKLLSGGIGHNFVCYFLG